jgi:hypothetical protein
VRRNAANAKCRPLQTSTLARKMPIGIESEAQSFDGKTAALRA